MKITIIDAYHDSDRGGVGILLGLVNLINGVLEHKNISPEYRIIRRFHVKDSRYHTANRHVAALLPDTQILGSPIAISFWGIIKAIFGLVLLRFGDQEVINTIKSSDRVISKGGHFYTSMTRNPVKGLISGFIEFYVPLLVLRLSKPIIFISHSVGPFNNWGARLVAGFVFKRASFCSAREEYSRAILKDLGVEQVSVWPDTAFALDPASNERLYEYFTEGTNKILRSQQYAVLTPRLWDFPQKESENDYLETMAQLADYMIEKGFVQQVFLVVHNDGLQRTDSDIVPVNEIFNRIQNKHRCSVVDHDLPPDVQSKLYGEARIIVGTRLHSIIFALVGGGTPFIAVNYSHKVQGILEMLSAQRYMLNVGDYEKGTALVDEIFGMDQEIRTNNIKNVTDCRDSLTKVMKKVIFPEDGNESLLH